MFCTLSCVQILHLTTALVTTNALLGSAQQSTEYSDFLLQSLPWSSQVKSLHQGIITERRIANTIYVSVPRLMVVVPRCCHGKDTYGKHARQWLQRPGKKVQHVFPQPLQPLLRLLAVRVLAITGTFFSSLCNYCCACAAAAQRRSAITWAGQTFQYHFLLQTFQYHFLVQTFQYHFLVQTFQYHFLVQTFQYHFLVQTFQYHFLVQTVQYHFLVHFADTKQEGEGREGFSQDVRRKCSL